MDMTMTTISGATCAMPKMTVTAEIESYPAIFRNSLLAMAHDAQHTIETTKHTPPVETRMQAVHLLDFLLKHTETWPVARELLITLAPKMELAGHRDDWMPYLEKGIDYSRQQQEIVTEGELTAQLGLLYQLRGQLELAYENFANAEMLFQSKGDMQNQARMLNRMGHVACLMQEYELAEKLANNVLAFPAIKKTEYAISYHVLGKLALTQRNWEQAEDYFQSALEIWQADGDRRQIARRRRELGTMYGKQGNYRQSIIELQEAATLFGSVGDEIQQAIVWMNLGVAYLLAEQPRSALDYLMKAEPKLLESQDLWHLGMLYTNLGIAYRAQKDWVSAEKALYTSITYRQRSNHREHMINSLFELGLLYVDCRSWGEATTTLGKAFEILPTISDSHRREYYRNRITATLKTIQSSAAEA